MFCKINKFFLLKINNANLKVRDLEGAEGGTSWSERRDGCSEMGSIWLSEVQRSTGAIADPGKSPTAWVESWGGNAGMPK